MERLAVILFCAEAPAVAIAQIFLRFGIALLGSLEEPFKGLMRVFLHATAQLEEEPRLFLGPDKSVLRRFFEPENCLLGISLNADAFVNFSLDADGKIREMRMEPVSPLTDFSFDFQDLRLVPVAAKK